MAGPGGPGSWVGTGGGTPAAAGSTLPTFCVAGSVGVYGGGGSGMTIVVACIVESFVLPDEGAVGEICGVINGGAVRFAGARLCCVEDEVRGACERWRCWLRAVRAAAPPPLCTVTAGGCPATATA